MYGVGEIEDESFISFVNHDSEMDSIIASPKFDLSGVVIDLNFEVTKEAEIREIRMLLRNDLKCSICINMLVKPITLECGHT